MSSIPSQVQRAIDQDYRFRFGDYIGQVFGVVRQNIGPFMGYTAVFFLTVTVLGFIPFIGTLGIVILPPCLTVGFYIAARKIEERQSLEFSDFFKGLDFLPPLLVATMMQAGIIIAVLIPFFAALFLTIDPANGEFGAFPWWAFDLMGPMIYLAIAWSFAPLLIVFQRMKAGDALEASRKIISKRWGAFWGFTLLISLLGLSGVIIFLMGILFTYPVYLVSMYAAFRDVVGFPEGSDGETNIADHLVE